MKIKKNFGNTPFGALSETQGYATETNNFGESAFGILNKSTIDEDNFTSPDVVKSSKATLFSVGNGSDGVRKNIIELKADGTVYISGIGSYDGTTTDGASTIQDTIQDTNDQVQNVIEELEKVNTSIDSINIEKSQDSDLVYTLRVDGEDRGTINIPKDQFLKDVSYNDVTNELVFTFVTKDTDNKVITTNLNDLVDIYNAGDGLQLSSGKFSIKLDPSTESYLTVSENGLKISGIDQKFEELNTKIGSNTYTGSNYLTKETNLTDAVIQLDEEIKATNDNLALEHANAEAAYAKKTDLSEYLLLNGGVVSGNITFRRRYNGIDINNGMDHAYYRAEGLYNNELSNSENHYLILGLADDSSPYYNYVHLSLENSSLDIQSTGNEMFIRVGSVQSYVNISSHGITSVIDNPNKMFTTDGGTISVQDIISQVAVPTKVSDLTNDSGFQTEAQIDAKISTKADKTIATTSADGLMSSSDKTKLDGIDTQNLATKSEVNAKVSGTGVSSIQVVATLPDVQEEGVLYIVTGEGA